MEMSLGEGCLLDIGTAPCMMSHEVEIIVVGRNYAAVDNRARRRVGIASPRPKVEARR